MRIFEMILDNSLLNKALNWVIKNNTSNFFPYHNLYHLLTVTENCNEGANYYEITEPEKTTLLLAALFHDVNYVVDKTWADVQKITLAIEALRQFRKEISLRTVVPVIDWEQTESILRATEFPHKIFQKFL
jgi:HD superfamily phosphodiesterase